MDSPVQPEVTWFKDNLPLNSPDYETCYGNGIATLTIEETFSEDTARYTVRFTTPAGSADSSAHLTVRGHLSYYYLFLSNYSYHYPTFLQF